MQTREFLNSVCTQIKYKPIRNEILEELQSHIEDEKEYYLENGMKEKEAEEEVINQMGNPEEIGKRLNKIHKPKLDWILLILIGIVISFGILVTFIRNNNYDLFEYGIQMSIQRFIATTIIGITLGIGIYFFDYRKLAQYSKYLYIIATTLILYLSYNGENKTEFAIIFMLIYIISFVGFLEKTKKFNSKNIVKLVMTNIISIYLIGTQNSVTMAIILEIIYLIISTAKVLIVSKNKIKHISMLWGIPIILTTIISALYFTQSGGFRLQRILVMYHPERYPEGWQILKQKEIIKTAKLIGNSKKSNELSFLDAGTTHAFIAVLENYGYITSIIMILSIIVLNIKLIINSIKIQDNYGKLIVIGITSMFIIQTICNLLMNFGIGIQANFNLPLISYGNTNLIINITSLALILSIYRRKDIILTKNK